MATFEIYEPDGTTLRASSDFPAFQLDTKDVVQSVGSSYPASGGAWNPDFIAIATYAPRTDGKYDRYIYKPASQVVPPNNALAANLLVYSSTVANQITFYLGKPALNIVTKEFINESNYQTKRIVANGKRLGISSIKSTSPTQYSVVNTYVYHNIRYYNVRVTTWMMVVVAQSNGDFTFTIASESYMEYGLTVVPQPVDVETTLEALITDVSNY